MKKVVVGVANLFMFDRNSHAFEIFDLPLVYEVDLFLLDKKYRLLQRQWHPDQFIVLSELKRKEAAEKTVQINQAYQQLRDPMMRANLLVQLIFPDQPEPSLSSSLMLEQFQLQEKVEQTHVSEDLRQELVEKIKQHKENFAKNLKAKKSQALEDLVFLRFLNRALSRLENRKG